VFKCLVHARFFPATLTSTTSTARERTALRTASYNLEGGEWDCGWGKPSTMGGMFISGSGWSRKLLLRTQRRGPPLRSNTIRFDGAWRFYFLYTAFRLSLKHPYSLSPDPLRCSFCEVLEYEL